MSRNLRGGQDELSFINHKLSTSMHSTRIALCFASWHLQPACINIRHLPATTVTYPPSATSRSPIPTRCSIEVPTCKYWKLIIIIQAARRMSASLCFIRVLLFWHRYFNFPVKSTSDVSF